MVESMNFSDAIIIPVVVYQISRDSQVAEPNLDSQSTKKSLPSLLVIIVEKSGACEYLPRVSCRFPEF